MSESRLTADQRQAIETVDRPYLLVAAAGSGKTTVLVKRYCHLLSRGIQPDQILTVSFTNEAADQMRSRILLEPALQSDEKTRKAVERTYLIGTLHSFCYQLINEFGSQLKLPKIDKILTSFEFAHRFDSAYEAWLKQLPAETVSTFLDQLSPLELRMGIRETLVKRHQWTKSDLEILKAAKPLVDSFQESLLADHLYDFEDLEYYALHILKNSSVVRHWVREKIRSLLVDEFQDTSPIQWEILSRIIGKSLYKFFAVGDPRQSIYRFRNADVKVFHTIAQLVNQAGGTVGHLNTNFRSTAQLVAQVNEASRHLFHDTEFTFHPMESGRAQGTETFSPIEPLCYAADGTREQRQKEEITLFLTDLKKRLAEGVPPEEIAVLFRVSDSIPAYFEALSECGIPVQARTRTSLFDNYDILDLFYYLRSVEDPLDDFALSCFLRSSFVALSYSELNDLFQCPGDSLFEKLYQQKPAQLEWYLDLIDKGVTQPQALLSLLFSNASYFPNQTEAFLLFLAQTDLSQWTLSETLSRLRSWKREEVFVENGYGSASSAAIQLLTVHRAKGLEFSHVYLVDTLRQSPKQFPPLWIGTGGQIALRPKECSDSDDYTKIRLENSHADSQESRRILYVALTRAKNSLIILSPSNAKRVSKDSWASLLQQAGLL